jgi:hypothetical protein
MIEVNGGFPKDVKSYGPSHPLMVILCAIIKVVLAIKWFTMFHPLRRP